MLSDYRLNLKKLVAIAVPIMLSNLIYQAQMIIDKIFLGNVNSLYLSALGNATLTLSGEAAGRRDMSDLRNICITAYGICFAVSAATVLVCLLFPQQLVSIFTADPEVINNSALYMLLMSVGMFFRSGNIVIGNGIRATGDTTWMLLTQIFGTLWVSAVAVLLVYVFHIGLTGIFLAVLLDEFVRSLHCLIRLLLK